MANMTLLDELRLKVEIASKNFRNQLISRGEAESLLPVDDIKVEIIPGGVKVDFIDLGNAPGDVTVEASEKPAAKATGKQKFGSDK